jgi:hypothetical protein
VREWNILLELVFCDFCRLHHSLRCYISGADRWSIGNCWTYKGHTMYYHPVTTFFLVTTGEICMRYEHIDNNRYKYRCYFNGVSSQFSHIAGHRDNECCVRMSIHVALIWREMIAGIAKGEVKYR